jgi:hypothetical protein
MCLSSIMPFDEITLDDYFNRNKAPIIPFLSSPAYGNPNLYRDEEIVIATATILIPQLQGLLYTLERYTGFWDQDDVRDVYGVVKGLEVAFTHGFVIPEIGSKEFHNIYHGLLEQKNLALEMEKARRIIVGRATQSDYE